MTGESNGADDRPKDRQIIPPEKMSVSFYAALGLIIILVLMVVVINYPAAKANAGMALTRTNWTLQSLMDRTGILVPAISGSDMTAQFDSDGRMDGRAGCNQYFASYATKDYQIAISGIGSTKMFCRDDGIMEQESSFLSGLSRVASFRAGNSSLTFYDASGRTVMVFVPS